MHSYMTMLHNIFHYTHVQHFWMIEFSVQFSSFVQSCPTLCDLMNHNTTGCPVHHTPGVTQTHVHRVGDAIQPSHPLSSPSPPAPKPSQHQYCAICLFISLFNFVYNIFPDFIICKNFSMDSFWIFQVKIKSSIYYDNRMLFFEILYLISFSGLLK